jgi:hypothetical protein
VNARRLSNQKKDEQVRNRFLTLATAVVAIFYTGFALADHHETGPIGYAAIYSLKVSDPAAIAAAMTKVRTSKELAASPSGVSLSQVIAGGASGVTHTVGVFYDSLADMDAAQAMNAGSKVIAEVGPVFRSASERLTVDLLALQRRSVKEGAVTAENPVNFVYQLSVTDQAAFMTAFDNIWDSVTKSFPGNVFFGTSLVNGTSKATHFVTFVANDMETLIGGVQAMQSSPEMADYMANAASFRTVEAEIVGMRMLNFPAPAN